MVDVALLGLEHDGRALGAEQPLGTGERLELVAFDIDLHEADVVEIEVVEGDHLHLSLDPVGRVDALDRVLPEPSQGVPPGSVVGDQRGLALGMPRRPPRAP